MQDAKFDLAMYYLVAGEPNSGLLPRGYAYDSLVGRVSAALARLPLVRPTTLSLLEDRAAGLKDELDKIIIDGQTLNGHDGGDGAKDLAANLAERMLVLYRDVSAIPGA